MHQINFSQVKLVYVCVLQGCKSYSCSGLKKNGHVWATRFNPSIKFPCPLLWWAKNSELNVFVTWSWFEEATFCVHFFHLCFLRKNSCVLQGVKVIGIKHYKLQALKFWNNYNLPLSINYFIFSKANIFIEIVKKKKLKHDCH